MVARELGFAEPKALSALTTELAHFTSPALVAFLCPDAVIGSIYHEVLAQVAAPMTLILAHGYAVYAGDLKPARPEHELALFAPKAIGPKIWALFQEARGDTHRLVAGFHASPERAPAVQAFAQAMGFAPGNLVPASFEQEAVGDMISEQGLLCGGVFTLMEWTLEAMRAAGIPERLIREECLTELELIAGLLRERGPATTFRAISQAAQAGTIAMQQALERSDARVHFDRQLKEVVDRRFAEYFRSGKWQPQAQEFTRRLEHWEKELSPKKELKK